jgi:hypothetical protein
MAGQLREGAFRVLGAAPAAAGHARSSSEPDGKLEGGPDPVAYIESALRRSREVTDVLASGMAAQSPVLLVVNDPQRSTPTSTALRALGRVVRDAPGSARLHLLIATGTHRFDATVRERFVAALLDGCDLLVDGVTWPIALRIDDAAMTTTVLAAPRA